MAAPSSARLRANCISDALAVQYAAAFLDATNPFSNNDELHTDDSVKTFIYWIRNDIDRLSKILTEEQIKNLQTFEARRTALIDYMSKLPKDTIIVYKDNDTMAKLYMAMLIGKVWYNPRGISKVEFVHTTHTPRNHAAPDLHVTKERLVLNDGSIVPRVKLIKDYKVPFWITKKIFRRPLALRPHFTLGV